MPPDLLVAKLVHVLAAIVWVGGTLFLVTVAVPALRPLPPGERAAVMARLGRRFRPVGWGALLALVATGLHTMARSSLLSASTLTRTPNGRLLLLKLALVAGILVLTAAHDLVTRPRPGREPANRRVMLGLARSSAVLTLAVPVIGVLLAH